MLFERGWVTLNENFRRKGASPTNEFWPQKTRVPGLSYGEKKLPKISTGWVGRTNVTDRQTDRRQTDLRWHIANVNASSRPLKTVWFTVYIVPRGTSVMNAYIGIRINVVVSRQIRHHHRTCCFRRVTSSCATLHLVNIAGRLSFTVSNSSTEVSLGVVLNTHLQFDGRQGIRPGTLVSQWRVRSPLFLEIAQTMTYTASSLVGLTTATPPLVPPLRLWSPVLPNNV